MPTPGWPLTQSPAGTQTLADINHFAAHSQFVDAVAHYGAVGDGTTDDTAALVAAANKAKTANACLLLPSGKTFKVTAGNVIFASDVMAIGANITTTSASGAAVQVGDGVTYIRHKTMFLPSITQTTRTWGGNDIGVQISGVLESEIHIPYVAEFSKGVYALGSSTLAVSYDAFYLGHLSDNQINLHIYDGGNSSGYTNECNWHGGRYAHFSARGTDVAGTKHIYVQYSGVANIPNNHRFWGPSLEGNTAEYLWDCQGSDNYVIYPRYEATPARVRFDGTTGAGARNHSLMGYGASAVTFSQASGASGNGWLTSVNDFIRSANGTLQVQESLILQNVFLINANGLRNSSTGDNASIDLNIAGIHALRNKADANPALIVDQQHASSTGAPLRLTNAAGSADFFNSAGSPEGVVTAGPGSYCADITNGEGYIKNTGTGNTGWKKVTHA